MKKYVLGEMEQKFANIIWRESPISSGDLVKICKVELTWKKSTTYTMLKRLCQRNIFENTNGTVKTLISKDQFLAEKGEEFINSNFSGSLPKFITAFTKNKKLSSDEINDIKLLIESYQED